MSGELDEAKGKVKQAAGDLTDDRDLKNEGKLDEASGKAKGALDDVKEKAEDVVDAIRDKFKRD
ncbi:MAG: CsbD family protein [Actinobacteria bacterium]|nr:CsbD family protein [Actinomycetota bacterium]